VLREISGDLYQAGECVAGPAGHEAMRVYVLMNAGHPILIDCGSQLHRAGVMHAIESALAGQAPEYVFLTHSELPHAGNLAQVARQWPNIQVMVSNIMLPYIEIAPVLPLAQISAATPGSAVEIGGRRLQFVEALLKDQPGSQWIWDEQTGALFTGDAFGYSHAPEHCERFSDEIVGGVRVEQFERYHRAAFRFLRWVVASRLNAELGQLFERYPAKIVAPIHGNAIRGDIAAHVTRLQQALANVCGAQARAEAGRA
jgi:flavorubredoxin